MTDVGRMADSASSFNCLDQYVSSRGNGTYCYAELIGSSLVAEVIASTHCAYPRRGGQVELACVAGYILRCLSGR